MGKSPRLALRHEHGGQAVRRSAKDGKSPLTAAGWLALVVLAAFFFISLWYALRVWTSMAGVHMSGAGWFFLVLGVIVTIALGAGLMGLVFYSARHDMDR